MCEVWIGFVGGRLMFVREYFATILIFFEEKVSGKFIFIDLDEVESRFGLTQAMIIIISLNDSVS